MAVKPRVTGSLEQNRLGTRTRTGSFAFHRKQSAQSSRASMAEITKRYSDTLNMLSDITGEVLREILEPVLRKAQVYCPVRTGDLMNTGRIVVDVSAKHRATATIMFGSSGVKYAALVHERMGVFHKPPTRAKFLQSAMEEELSGVLAHAAVLYAAVLK